MVNALNLSKFSTINSIGNMRMSRYVRHHIDLYKFHIPPYSHTGSEPVVTILDISIRLNRIVTNNGQISPEHQTHAYSLLVVV